MSEERALTPVQQRWLFGGGAVALAAVGIAVSLSGAGEDEPAPAPSPTPETTVDPDQVDDWFPWSRGEFAAAGQAAAEFGAELATVSEGEDFEDYRGRIGEHTTGTSYAGVASEEGGSGPWRPLAERGEDLAGRAHIQQVSFYDDATVWLETDVAAYPEQGDPIELGVYTVVVRQDGDTGAWAVEQAHHEDDDGHAH